MSAGRQRLQELFASLDGDNRRTLLAFAEFLAARHVPASADVPVAPRADLPRPDAESVIAALRRLRETYPMLDSAPLLDAATRLVTAHVLHGRGAAEVIDELEVLFERAYSGRAAGGEASR